MSQTSSATSLQDSVKSLETSALSDVLDGLGRHHQTLARNFRPFGAAGGFSGPAVCASLIQAVTASNAVGPKEYFAAIDAMSAPGKVMVLQVPDNAEGALMGGFMAREFKRRGAKALITNGLVRDAAELGTLPLSVMAFGATPRNGARNLTVESVGNPIFLPGERGVPVRICDGDLVVGDMDGIVIVPRVMADIVIAATLRLSEVEQRITHAMNEGMTRLDAMRENDRFGHLAAAREAVQLLSC
jgi:4-hydroxy-4-methyl-2-oxoglutarate aldolase